MASSTTHLHLISQSQAQKETTANNMFDAASPAMVYARDGNTTTGLTWGYLGGNTLLGSTPTFVANGTVTLTASATNYIRKLDSTGVVSFTTSLPSGWPAPNGGYTPLYSVVTGTNSVTSYDEKRVGGGVPGAAGASFTEPTGTGFHASTSGVTDAAARAVNVSTADVTGTLAAARMPALTGEVTSTVGTVATTIVASAITAAKVWAKNQSTVFVALTDGANIATDASLSNNFRVVLAGNRTLDNPTNLTDGMVLNWYIKQDATGTRTLAYGSKFIFFGGTNTLSTAANAKDLISAVYTSTDDVILCNLVKAAS